MTSKLKTSKLKSYHIFLLGCLLGVLLVLNSNYVNEKKLKIQQDKKEQALFNRLISQRRLQDNSASNGLFGEDEEVYESDIICSYASEELQEYYNTSDLSKIDLDDGPIKCEDKDEDYMKTLIEIVKSLMGDGDDEEEEDERRALRNLIDSDTKENIKKYGKRLLPWLVFAAFGILSALGWIVCCFCNCCNCCCCCCCKKTTCKIPCFIITYVFYAAVVAVSIYGFTQTNKIFTGLSNTECSFIRFFETILFGETRDENNNDPKWIGIEGVTNILNNLNTEITEMDDSNLEEELELNVQEIDEKRDTFFSALKSVHKNFYMLDTDGNIIEPKQTKPWYYKEYNTVDNIEINVGSSPNKLEGKYVLDLIPKFGEYNEADDIYTGLNNYWNLEISTIDANAGRAVEDAEGSFTRMLGENLDKIKEGLEKGDDNLGKLRDPLNDIYDSISGLLYDASEMTNDYGKKSVKYVFGALILMNSFLALATLMICLLSSQTCDHCCLCRCLCKMAVHLIWNILALCMIVSFLIGSILALVGQVGGDVMSLVSYIMSEENFKSNDPVIINELGSGKDVLEECMVGNGNLSKVFDLDDYTRDFDTIYRVKGEIAEYKQNFTDITTRYEAYHRLKKYLENRTEFIDDTEFKIIDNNNLEGNVASAFKLSEIIKKLNDSIDLDPDLDEKWNPYTGDKNIICNSEFQSSGSTTNNILHPWTCEPIYRGWVNSASTNIKNYAKIVSNAIEILKYANGEKEHSDTNYQSYFDVLDSLKGIYEDYLGSFINVLDFFDRITGRIIDILEDGIGNSNETFSFLNGKFIKTNLKIILKYLKHSLGEDIYTVGICLVVVGFSLIFSISLTILLIVIINIFIENNKKLAKNTDIPDFPVTNDGRVVQFKY